MAMHVHELHAATVHAPLVLLPTAALIDLAASISDDGHSSVGRTLWWATVGAGVFSGVSGLAASQEVRADSIDARNTMWLHGAVNTAVILGVLGMATYRTRNRATAASATAGLALGAAAVFTAYLGGEMVYTHGIGVKPMPAASVGGVENSPPLLSRQALPTLLADAGRGLSWLLRRARFLGRRSEMAELTEA